DGVAAMVARAVGAERCFGLGGAACRRAGVDLVDEIGGVMGIADAALAGPRIARALGRLALAIARRKPRAALLVNASELAARLGRVLRARGVHVVWCVAPQVW